MTQARRLAVTFVGDEDVVDHIVEKQQEAKAAGAAQTLVTLKASRKAKAKASAEEEEEDEEELCEQDYAEALFTGAAGEGDGGGGVSSGSCVFSFQTGKRGNKMAEMASEWVKTPGKTVTFSTSDASEETTSPTHSSRRSASQSKTPQKGKKAQFVSTTPHRLRRRLTAPSLRSDSESDLSPSGSEEDECEEVQQKHKTPGKRRRAPEPDLVEEYFQAHSSSKVLTSDRTLQKLQTPRLDRETLIKLLGNNRPSFSQEIQQLNIKHEQNFRRWMLQLHLGYNILLYGLGSKKRLLEKFRVSMLSGFTQVVVNGFFPSVTLRAILTCFTTEVLEHHGTFRSPAEQLDFILKSLREDGSNHVFLIIHNIDGHMLRGERVQQALAQLASLPTVHVLASVDHINAPLVWDQVRSGGFNWLWYESTSFLPYTEETSYENSLLVRHTGSLALSSLTHVLHSLTPNARGIFRLLAEYQLENKDNPAYSGLCFQDLYQRCRESFLVNSDITLRTQLTEFRDHKLIRQKKGADGVEYLTVPVDNTTLSDFLEKKDLD